MPSTRIRFSSAVRCLLGLFLLWWLAVFLQMFDHTLKLEDAMTVGDKNYGSRIHKRTTRHQVSTDSKEIHTRTCTILGKTITLSEVPQFLIIGAQKSGTTAIFEALKQHPNLQASSSNETHFFDWHYPDPAYLDEWLKKRQFPTTMSHADLQCAIHDEYAKNFNVSSLTTTDTLFFEKTPSYLFLTDVPKRITATCFWKPKVIVLLRNPVDRAFSHYRMHRLGKSFDEWVDIELESMRKIGLSTAPHRSLPGIQENDPRFNIPEHSVERSGALEWKHYRKMHLSNHLQRGMYVNQLRHWIPQFPLHESLLVVNYEKFRSKPAQVYKQILNFIGAAEFEPSQGVFEKEYNTRGAVLHPISNSTRQFLSSLFQPYNDKLADMLGDEWRGIWDDEADD